MRALIVVMRTVLTQDRLEVAPIEDQHPVEALATAAADPALGMVWGSNNTSRCHSHAAVVAE